MSLWQDFLTNDQRVAHKWKHYFPAYERHFARFVNTDVNFLEIGCGEGGSLQMWKRYLGPHARIVGIDVDARCTAFQEDQIAVCIGDQANVEFLAGVVQAHGPFDIVLDDGSHRMTDVTAAFLALYPTVPRKGVYMVEDMHTAYAEPWGGGLRRAGTFIERCKDLIDELNGAWFGQMTPFTSNTLSMHFYDSIVVFEKGRLTQRRDFAIGGPT
jgi:SAM-dependent methyltransferase